MLKNIEATAPYGLWYIFHHMQNSLEQKSLIGKSHKTCRFQFDEICD